MAPERSRALVSRLGFLGLTPFGALAAATVFASGPMRAIAAAALLTYGATILSFLGGIFWGLTLARPALSTRESALFLGLGVTPQLLGWAALLIPAPWGHLLTAAGVVALLALDRAAVRSGIAPDWFLHLRWPLSCIAAIAMIIGALSL